MKFRLYILLETIGQDSKDFQAIEESRKFCLPFSFFRSFPPTARDTVGFFMPAFSEFCIVVTGFLSEGSGRGGTLDITH